METRNLEVHRARVHNLRNVSVDLTRNRLICFTGVSGSGKSSLAFDTIYAEGQRRYIESLSAYARQFLGQMEKPDVDAIRGISPTLSIEQKAAGRNPRSTVGTITEIFDYLRVLFSRVGTPHCVKCGKPIGAQSREGIVERILGLGEGTRIHVMAPIVKKRKGEYVELFQELLRDGYVRARVDGKLVDLTETPRLGRYIKHDIDVVVDRLVVRPDERVRVAEAVDAALRLGQGTVVVSMERGENRRGEGRKNSGKALDPPLVPDKVGTDGAKGAGEWDELLLSCNFACTECGISVEEPTPQMFSFNNPQGMCPECSGLGTRFAMDLSLVVPDERLSLMDGAITPIGVPANRWKLHYYEGVLNHFGFNCRDPWEKVSDEARRSLLYGMGNRKIWFSWRRRNGSISRHRDTFEGILAPLERKYVEGRSHAMRKVGKFMRTSPCEACEGARLRLEALSVKIAGRSIADVVKMPVEEAHDFFSSLELNRTQQIIAEDALKEIAGRLKFLLDVGLGYLALDRTAPTLAGGEAQRIRLASQIGSGLVGVTYVLDEPSIGLHNRDNRKLLNALGSLRDAGNTVIVVEHDEETMKEADMIVDFGPGPGHRGGEITAVGDWKEVASSPESVTGDYLAGRRKIAIPDRRRTIDGRWLEVYGACQNNLKEIDVRIPIGRLTCVTGVSGSGKSSLINDVVYASLARDLNGALIEPGAFRDIKGTDHLDKVIKIDQQPIGRTPRSNPATYTGVFTPIRELFAELPESKVRGYKPGRFSFNVKGGRCAACDGYGANLVEMDFLADVWVQCPVCEGQRFNRETLEVRFKGMSIAQVQDMEVEEALAFFKDIPRIRRILQTLEDVGMGYVKLGQPAPTLSGGEAQRVKLASELCRKSTGKTLYILDEPTTGLHFADIQNLLNVLHRFVDEGNTVIVIEHNMEIIKTADWLIDLGPDGGDGGGEVVATGTPEAVSRVKGSYTGNVLKEILNGRGAGGRLSEARKKTKGGRGKKETGGVPDSALPVVPDLREKGGMTHIQVVGARENNLRNVNVRIPRERMTVVSGVSGSGKSSFALDTVYAEGRRRYVESLSTYARQFLGQMQKPKVERVIGLSPAISIEQKAVSKNPRSTVGTVTEVYDYLRALLATVGTRYCPDCDVKVGAQTVQEMVDRILDMPGGRRLLLLAPLAPGKGEDYETILNRMRRNGFVRGRLDGKMFDLKKEIEIDHRQNHRLEIVVDRLSVSRRSARRFADSVAIALDLSGGALIVASPDDSRELRLSQHLSCPSCGRGFESLTPQHFSFNHYEGWCPNCEGLGVQEGLNRGTVVPDSRKSLRDGAVAVWGPLRGRPLGAMISSLGKIEGFDLDTPFRDMDPKDHRCLLQGTGDRWIKGPGGFKFRFKGIFPAVEEVVRASRRLREAIGHEVQEIVCPECEGSRIRPESRAVRLQGRTVMDLSRMPISDCRIFFDKLRLDQRRRKAAGEVLNEIKGRLRFLDDVGLDYLTLDRRAPTLSGGESQRIRLAGQIGSGLTGVLYVLDEPTIGLHPRDNRRLLKALKRLRNLGNTLIVVEHDRDTLLSADHVLDFGPGAGAQGGYLVAEGRPRELNRGNGSLTGQYLSGKLQIDVPLKRRKSNRGLEVLGAWHNNLKGIDVKIPIGVFTCVTGVSGSGKSSLVNDVVHGGLSREIEGSRNAEGACDEIRGTDALDKVISIDQAPIGHSPRSNPLTYVGGFNGIRDLFSRLPESRKRGYSPRQFSFNVGRGRCESCEGIGARRIEMHFLPDVYVTCDACRGKRYTPETLDIRYKGLSIADVLERTISEALEHFSEIPKIRRTLQTLEDVGLGYMATGQSSRTLSGGEAQRVKLASELSRPSTGKTIYFLDEPTTGLHVADIKNLLKVLNRLVDAGNTVVVIEHNMDVIKTADWVIDLGPEGGEQGGEVVAVGTPEEVAKVDASHTGRILQEVLGSS